ncbi:HlyD family efflux transporter periplasmic adaptor subunit [Candidatus Falkowbacteria bacterium]|nr:HlyD family efflux transporter periplasmic adaptor subunit [Candidatus Falkowbacteria bacterium]
MTLKGKKRYLVIAGVILAAGGFFYNSYKQGNKVEYTTAEAKLSRIVQTVNETGTVKTATEIKLNFLANGKIAKIGAKIGDKVKKDQVLAELDYSNLLIQQKQAQANLDVAKANLAKIANGATVQDVTISLSSVKQAETAYVNAQANYEKVKKSTAEAIVQAQKNLSDLESSNKAASTYGQAILTAQNNLDNTNRTYLQTISNRRTSLLNSAENQIAAAQAALDAANRVFTDDNAKDTLSIQDAGQLIKAKASYDAALILVAPARADLADGKRTGANNDALTAANSVLGLLNETLDVLNATFAALSKSVTSSKFSQASLDAFKTSISAQNTAINAGISSISTAEQNLSDTVLAYNTNLSSAQSSLDQAQAAFNNALTNARNALTNARLSGDQQNANAKSQVDATLTSYKLAQAQYNKTVAPARPEDFKLFEAQVAQAKANLDALINQANNSIIKSPIDGEITQVNYEIGEEPGAAKPVMAILSHDNFEIELDISEADIVKVKQGNPASVTFDALGEAAKFAADVTFIEPAQTVIQEVVYYKCTVSNLRSLDAAGDPLGSTAGTSSASTTPVAPSTSTSSPLRLIRPGMTANVSITTAIKDQVLIVPSRAVIDKGNSQKVVRLLVNNQFVETPVTVGLRGDEGLTEIISGLKPGDLAITSIKNAPAVNQ